jgi:hypothetical protein
MPLNVGFRSVEVKESVTSVDFGRAGCQQIEVTNAGATTIKVYMNEFEGKLSSQGVPVLAGQTRIIPMYVFNLRATGAITVVGYRA